MTAYERGKPVSDHRRRQKRDWFRAHGKAWRAARKPPRVTVYCHNCGVPMTRSGGWLKPDGSPPRGTFLTCSSRCAQACSYRLRRRLTGRGARGAM